MMSMTDDQARDDAPAADVTVTDRRVDDDFADDGGVVPAGGYGVLAGMAAIQGEMVSLAGTRWAEVLQMPGLLLECGGDPAKTIAVQVGFAERAGAHYLEASYRLMALATQVARDCWWPGASGAFGLGRLPAWRERIAAA
jgi:hypothetical protein